MSTVLVACGGRGERLGYDGQKCMISTAGRPFLHWKLDQLIANGATELILLVAHHRHDVVVATRDFDVDCLKDDGVGAWAAVERVAEHMPPTFWVTWGDTLFDAPLGDDYTSLMYITDKFYGEHPNLTSRLLDAGLYHVSRDNPHPQSWYWRYSPNPTLTINTPEQLEHTDETLRRYGLVGGNRRVGHPSLG